MSARIYIKFVKCDTERMNKKKRNYTYAQTFIICNIYANYCFFLSKSVMKYASTDRKNHKIFFKKNNNSIFITKLLNTV